MNKGKGPEGRKLSAIAKTECVLLVLSLDAFKLVCYEKTKQKNEEKTNFVYNTLTPLRWYPQKMLHGDI